MKRLLLIALSLLFLISLISCREHKSERILRSLQGDWFSTVESESFISIRDSTYFNGDQYEEFESLFFKNDSIFTVNGYFLLSDARITDKYLWGFNQELNKEIPSFKRARIYHDENIKLKSLEVRFINFWHRGLTDWALYLNEDLDCFLKVERTDVNRQTRNPLLYSPGIYYKKLEPTNFEFFEDKFRNVPLSKIKKEYESDDYFPGITCIGPADNTQLLFTCEFGVGDSDETKNISFEVRGFMHALPGYLGAFLFHINKIHDFIKFEQTDKFHAFQFYTPEYKEYFFNKAMAEFNEKYEAPK